MLTLHEHVIAIDIETKEDKDISKFGPGSHRHYLDGEDSYILGVAISDSENDYYLPASKETFDWLRSVQHDHTWVGHNLLYDLSWLYYEGFRPRLLADTMGMVRLMDENRLSYSLDNCAADFLDAHKNEGEIKAWCEENKLRGNPQKWLWKMPEEMVARYAKVDTRLAYRLWQLLDPEIKRQELSQIWNIECELLPILADTHHRGLRIDDDRRHEASQMLANEVAELKRWLVEKAGTDFNTNSSKQKAPIFDKLGIPYGKTEKGNPSFKAEDLLPYGIEPDMEYFPHVLVTHNKLEKLKRDFVDRLGDFMVQGRIRPMVNPYGTKTGRPSSSTPNIFQIPKRGRGKEICRVLFLPEEGEEWASMDYASEEYRIFSHYAVGPGSDRYRENYNADLKYDMHIENAKLAGVDRPKAKTIGLGVLFGMGKNKMASNLGVPKAEGLVVVDRFHRANPAFRETSQYIGDIAKNRPIRTKLGRKHHLNRENSYCGLNRLTQGNAGDLAKLTIVLAHKAGLFDHVTFLLWLYDEYNLSSTPANRKYVEEFKRIGETAVTFSVPLPLDLEYGPSWGEVS